LPLPGQGKDGQLSRWKLSTAFHLTGEHRRTRPVPGQELAGYRLEHRVQAMHPELPRPVSRPAGLSGVSKQMIYQALEPEAVSTPARAERHRAEPQRHQAVALTQAPGVLTLPARPWVTLAGSSPPGSWR
jgi:hypothetical protein